MNIDAKLLNKILATKSQQQIKKRSHTMTKWDSSPVHKNGSAYTKSTTLHHINKSTNTYISIDVEKALNKIQHPFMIKNSYQSRNRGNISQHNQVIYDKPTDNIILNSEKLKAFPLKSGTS